MKDNTRLIRDCSRGCKIQRTPRGELQCSMDYGSCKLATFDWLGDLQQESLKDYFEVRFKNTHKAFFVNQSGQELHKGDIVAVEAANGHDVGIISMEGPLLGKQMNRRKINPGTYAFRKIYRKAKAIDIEKWQEAIAREHDTMIRARQIAAEIGLEMKIGDVEFQGDGTKAVFYYIADERVDFRKLIKLFAAEFRIRIEMRQFGARQEAGLIGGIGVCGQELCCSRWMADFISITTQAARVQDLSLNPQKLAGQCSKLKCCINYEASAYMDAQQRIPAVRTALDTEEGPLYLVKTDILKETMYFSYVPHGLSDLIPLPAAKVKEYLAWNEQGKKIRGLSQKPANRMPDFKSAVGEESITRFDNNGRKEGKRRSGRKPGKAGGDAANKAPKRNHEIQDR